MLEFLPVHDGPMPTSELSHPPIHTVPQRSLPTLAALNRTAPHHWNTSCLDWEERILEGRSLVPDLPLYPGPAELALRCFKRLRLPDVIGTPTLEEAAGPWIYPIIEALFGSYDPAANRRHISELFLLIPKGNSKSSTGGAIMLTALICNRRPSAEFLI